MTGMRPDRPRGAIKVGDLDPSPSCSSILFAVILAIVFCAWVIAMFGGASLVSLLPL